MRGTIRERVYESGTVVWRAKVDVPPEYRKQGEDRNRVSDTFETEEEAKNWLRKKNYEFGMGDYTEPSDQTLEDLLDQWIAHKECTESENGTIANYKRHISLHLNPNLGHIPLEDLGPFQLQSYFDTKKTKGRLDGQEGGLSGSYLGEQYSVLNQALDWAIKMQMIEQNALDSVERPTSKRSEIDYLNESELTQVLKAADKEARCGNAEVVLPTMIHTDSNTGFRQGELCGARWDDVDLQRSKITVRKQLTWTSGVGLEYKKVKTEKSRRTISLPSPVTKRLRDYKQRQHRQRMRLGEAWFDHKHYGEVVPEGTDLVFTREDGRPVTPSMIDKAFKGFLETAGLRSVKFHSLRHTHVSLLIKQGVDIKTISRRLGHKDVGVTLKVYGHLLPGMDEEAAEQFANAIYGQDGEVKSIAG